MFSWKKYICELGICAGTGYLIGWAYGAFLVWLGTLLVSLIGLTAAKIIITILFILFVPAIFCLYFFGMLKLQEVYEEKTGTKTAHPIFDWIVLGYKKISAKITGMTKVLVPATGEVRL